ncbi:hypothetical protein GUJ93_ZPchr0010g10739 [Zizania palustris]|uniref:Uncharacterized protein n=1 Tax=Zizania palustris TaxID=103762 RepID=A0A8J5THP6_ZIZPA|nr:hypothetical protein GUJ93_ZPchr0010g10739 [Zizania palustris]
MKKTLIMTVHMLPTRNIGVPESTAISEDLHHWLFHTRDTAPADASAVAAPPQLAHAFFVFRFELGDTAAVEDGDAAEAKEDLLDNAGRGAGAWAGYLGKWGRGD